MWPGQRIDTSPEYEPEIASASQQIVQVAEQLVASDNGSTKILAFPLFMAGFASPDAGQRQLILDLLTSLEPNTVGQNVQVTKQALNAIFEQQDDRFMLTGQSLDIDWLRVMAEMQITVVNFGI